MRSYQLNGIGMGKRNTEVLYQSCSPYLHGDVLLIDDIADTGETFNFLLDHFKRNKNINKITTCSVFVRRSSNYVPDYYAKDIVGNEWIGISLGLNNSSLFDMSAKKVVDIHQQLFFTSNHFYIDFL